MSSSPAMGARVRGAVRRLALALHLVHPPPPAPESVIERLVAMGFLSVGRMTYGAPTIKLWGPAGRRRALNGRVSIGAFCSIADEVVIFAGGNHRTDWVTTFPLRIQYGLPGAYEDGHPATGGDVVIGNDVWIGFGATIASGVTVGDGAVLAARSMVSSDVAPYTIVAGNPARPVRQRFGPDQVEALCRLRWWDWPDEVITAAAGVLSSGDVEALVAWAEEHAGPSPGGGPTTPDPGRPDAAG